MTRLERLYAYAIRDGEVERELQNRIGFIPPAEQAVWQLDAAINDRGIFIDDELALGAIKIDEAAHTAIDAELADITGGTVTAVGQTARIVSWLGANGCAVDNIHKGTLGHALTRVHISEAARRVMLLRRDGAHAAANKYAAMMARRADDGRMRGCFLYHGTSTGRWSGRGPQPQNFKREPPDGLDMAAAITAVKTGDLAHLRRLHPDNPLSIVGDVARGALCAEPGNKLIVADFSGIEARVLAWLAGELSEITQWAKFDETGVAEDEPYFITGMAMGLGRDQGKTCTLAFGYIGGVGAYRKLAPDDPADDDEIKRRQQMWQRTHPATVKFWRRIERAATQAMLNPGKTFEVNERLSFTYQGDFLRMRLPSGRELAYPYPRLMTGPYGDLVVIYMDNQQGKWVDCNHGRGAYGGIWTENAVSAVARDLFAAAMPRLEAAGYPIVLHVHDEIVAEVPEGFGSVDEFKEIITARPDWADDLPIAAKGRNGPRFCKIKPVDPHAHAENDDQARPREAHDAEPEIAAEPANTCGPSPNTQKSTRDAEDTVCDADNTTDDTVMRDNGYSSKSKRPFGRIETFYIYLDQNGAPYGRVTRTSTKRFVQARWENGEWVDKAPVPKIPYRRAIQRARVHLRR
jgi:DNA polymerase bacteriophage-type